ncbi:hypothetical protein [Xaviernesmea rhizosphaerae]|uniref:hypothetical protein n=1 Tax=Xaviernesmea rhizosphaerae TaxID=1672749 RepID=UPI003CC98B8A
MKSLIERIEHESASRVDGHVAPGAGRHSVNVRALGNDLLVGGRGSSMQIGSTSSTERCSQIREIIASVGSARRKYAEALRHISLPDEARGYLV